MYGQLRLMGSSLSYEGRVEICIDGNWGIVCDDSWGRLDAVVVCRQLGHSTSNVKAYRDAFFGVGSGPILLDDVRCTGSESTLLNCQHRTIGEHDCARTEAAGVSCDESPAVHPPVISSSTIIVLAVCGFICCVAGSAMVCKFIQRQRRLLISAQTTSTPSYSIHQAPPVYSEAFNHVVAYNSSNNIITVETDNDQYNNGVLQQDQSSNLQVVFLY
jgi:hypothetical protein